MAREKTQNTYSGGLDRDTSINKYSNNNYFHSENFRINTSSGLSDGVLENIDGNKLVVQTTNNRNIIGIEELGDNLILFTTSTTTIPDLDAHTVIDYIYKVPVSMIKAATSVITLNDAYYFNNPSGHLVYKGVLFLSTLNKIKSVSRYESSSIQKIYWVDGFNTFRYLNIIDSITNDLENIDPSRLSILPNIDEIPNITASVVSGGNLQASTIEYFVQFFEKNGIESNIVGKSNLVYVSKNSDRGSDIGTTSNKSINISFDYNQTIFNRVRLLAADYTSISTVPNLRIVSEQELQFGVNNFIDTGESLGSEDASALNSIKLDIKSNTIDVKDNILFTGNIKEDYFEITDSEFDSRAFRFNNSKIATVVNKSSSGFSNSISISYPSLNYDSIPMTHDAINRFNLNTYDYLANGVGYSAFSLYPYYYQSDGITVGGEGKYISYRFTTEKGDYLNSISDVRKVNPVINSKLKKCYQRGEVNRFAIVFFDKFGRQSFAKWIGDIRMPFVSQHAISVFHGDGIVPEYLYPEFKVTLPQAVKDKISGYEIVRVEMNSSNKSILATGIISPTVKRNGEIFYMGTTAYKSNDAREYLSFGTIKDYYATNLSHVASNASDNTINRKLIELSSPEINYNKNIELSENDFISVEGVFDNWGQISDSHDGNHFLYTKIETGSYSLAGSDRCKSIIDDLKISTPKSYKESSDRIGDASYASHSFDVIDEAQGGKSGTRLVCRLNSDLLGLNKSPYISSPSYYMYGSYKILNNSQYGGGTYSSRLNESYISCSGFINVDVSYSDNEYRTVRNGDVFITMFEYLRIVGDRTRGNDDRMQEVVYFPVESTINTQYKSNEFQTLLTGVNEYEETRDFYLLQETVAEGLKDFPRDVGNLYSYPESATDLYLYNSVYSRESNLKTYFSKSFDFESRNEFPYSIRNSEQKIDSEYIDNWLNFKSNNKNSVDSKYGGITKILTHNNNLYFFQPRAFGIASVNERSVIQDNNTTQLVLGTGGILDRFDYVSSNAGSEYADSIIGIESGIYFYDNISNKIVRHGSALNYISDDLNIASMLNNNGAPNNVITGYDHLNRDVNFCLKYDSGNKLLSYNEFSNCFTGLQTYDPNISFNKNDYLITSNSLKNLYIHNKGTKCRFYDAISDSKLTLIVNPNKDIINIYDVLDWLTIVYNSSNIEQQDSTISTIRLYNDYQDSGIISLSSTLPKRRFRTWRLNKLRDSLSKRFRDSNLKIDITFNNSNNNRLLLYDMFTTYYPTII